MDAKEKQLMQDRADALVNDWVFRPDLREQIVRVIEVTASPLHAALLVARCAMALNVLCFTLGTLAPLATVRWLILHGKL